MFKKLKDKIAEEVKSSPQRIQQIAQAVVSSASSTTSEVSGTDTFFSIAEEDTPQNSPQHITNSNSTNSLSSLTSSVTSTKTPTLNVSNSETTTNDRLNNSNNYNDQTSNRNRKVSTGSVGSDVSFRLPSYDSPAVYHLQSDLDMSASEVESPSSIILDRVSKEQLHQAYRRALDNHQKYRRRYADLAKKYGELERENSKARSVLVETQDKALRRISELREQCSLEQQAKAHLEAALRMELDDKDCLIQSLKTKLESEFEDSLMSISNKSIEDSNQQSNMLIDLNSPNVSDSVDSLDQSENIQKLENDLTKYKQDLEKQLEMNQNLEDKVQKLSADLTRYESQFGEYKINFDAKVIEADHYKGVVKELEAKLLQKSSDYDKLKASEEENALSIAESKQNMHKELENREKDVKLLTKKLQDLEKCTQDYLTLTDKVKSLENTLSKESAEWEGKLKVALNDKKDLEGRLKILQSDVKKLDDEKSELTKSCKLKDDKIADCLKEIDSLKTAKTTTDQQLTKNSKDLNELSNKISSLDWSIKQLESERIALIQKCDLLVKENEILTDTKEKLKHVSDTLLLEKQQIHQELMIAQQCLQEANIDAQSMKKEIDALKSGQETTRCVTEGKVQNELKSVRDKLLEAEKACQNLQQDCSLLQTEKANTQFELSNLRTTLLVLKHVLDNPQETIDKDKFVHDNQGPVSVNDLQNRAIKILHETKQKLSEFIQNDTKLTKLNENLQKRLEKLESDDVKKLQEKDSEVLDNVKKFESLQAKYDEVLDKWEKSEKATSEANFTLHKTVEDLERLKDVERKFLETEREFVDLQQKYDDVLVKFNANEELLKQTREELTSLEKSLQKDDDLSKLQTVHKDCLEQLKQNHGVSEETNTKLQNALENSLKLEKNLENLQKILQERESKLTQVSNQAQECHKNLEKSNKKLQNSSIEIEKLKTNLDLSLAKLTTTQEELAKVNQELDSYKSDLKTLSDSSEEVSSESRKLQEELAASKKKLEEVEGVLRKSEDSRSKEVESWKLKNEELSEKLQKYTRDFCELAGLDPASTSSQNSDQVLQELRAKLADLETRCQSLDEMKSENETLKSNLEKVQNEKDEASKEFTTTIQNLEREVTKLKDDKVYLNKTLTDMEEKNAGKQEELERLREDIQSLQASVQDQIDLQNSLSDLESAKSVQKDELYQQLSAENCQLQSKLQEVSSITNMLENLKQENIELTEKLKSLEEKYENTERSVESKISNLNQEIDLHIERIKYLEEKCKDYDSIKKINVELNKETQELTRKISELDVSQNASGGEKNQNQNTEVEVKLAQIMKEVDEVSNKNLF
ncbi:golgin subfamily A member 4 [Ctenocephalides felis]|uniref:golgin subfamily A member 4 n=1 Tax=Ctenocephalides felis TaxID=7515 RepID=UPI000E6E218C|nr:golgin subfamily A member 4 [Ctenocephalides felis]